MKTLIKLLACLVLFLYGSVTYAADEQFTFKLKSDESSNYRQEQKSKREENLKCCLPPEGLSEENEGINIELPESWEVSSRNPIRLSVEKDASLISSMNQERYGIWQSNIDKGASSIPPIIEIPDNTIIDTYTFWDSNNIYHILGEVIVENSGYLVLDPNVILSFAPERGRIKIRNDGVIKAKGTPTQWIYFYSDTGYFWNGYNLAIKIEPTASPLCEIHHCIITDAYYGIWLQNIQLENPIHDNWFLYCHEGITQEGPMLTDIVNNHVFEAWGFGIAAYLCDVNGISSKHASILIQNNLINGFLFEGYGQDVGIVVVGANDPNDAGIVKIINNHIDGSYSFAVYQDKWQEAYRICNGYSANYENFNPGNPFEGINEVIFDWFDDPFYFGYDAFSYGLPYVLEQDCALINAGYGYIDDPQNIPLIGKTTSPDSSPDVNKVDISYHYDNWDFSNAGATTLTADFDNNLTVDFNDLNLMTDMWLFDYQENYEVWWWDFDNSGVIDYNDLSVIAEYWLYPCNFRDFAEFARHWQKLVDYRFTETKYDLDKNGFVNFKDLAIFATEWQQTCEPVPANIAPSFDKDPNNLSGYVKVTIDVPESSGIYRAFLILDGHIHSEFYSLFDPEVPASISIATQHFSNGQHEVKIVAMYGNDANVVSCLPVGCVFNNELHDVIASNGFEAGRNYCFYGSGSGNYTVEVNDCVNDVVVYTQNFQDNIQLRIPADVFAKYGIYELALKKQIGQAQQATTQIIQSGESVTSMEVVAEEIIAMVFSKENFPQDCPIKMVISIGDSELEKDKEKCWRACIKAAVRKEIRPVFLNAKACTWENLSYCLLLDNVKMWYHVSHGNYDLLGQPPRQCITTASGKVFSYLKKDFDPNNIPPDYKELSWFYENNPSIAELGLVGTEKMIWVQFNACHSARTTEFPVMLGILPIKDPLMIGKQIFIGWKDSALVYDIIGKYNQFEEDYWDYLRQGYNLKDAVEYALPPQGGTRILKNFMYYGVVDWQYARFRYPNIN